MHSVGIKTLKNRLSEFVRAAATGETVLVTDRGQAVAELVPPWVRVGASPSQQRLGGLIAPGPADAGLSANQDQTASAPALDQAGRRAA